MKETQAQFTDKIICKGFAYDCEIGFHECEKGVQQTLSIDIEADCLPIPPEKRDHHDALRFDYDRANHLLKCFFEDHRQFKLIETVADDIARILLESFPVESITVRVTKIPFNISNLKSVSYECHRAKPR